MPYLVASIISIVTATIILITRYEADDSAIMSQLEKMKVMFFMVDGYVNTYIESGEILSAINFDNLLNSGLLPSNVNRVNPDSARVDGFSFASTLILPNSNVIWQLIPNINDPSSYKLLIDIRRNPDLMSKAVFSESFIGREFCENNLFAAFETATNRFDGNDFINDGNGTRDDGLFACVVFK